MHSFVSDPDQVRLIETWRLRHAYPDAIGIWAASSGVEAHAFAFNAIAQDPRVLRRAERLQAIKMATQAEDFAVSLSQTDSAKSDTWIAIALYVQRAIDLWRSSFRAYDRQGETVGMGGGAAIVRTRLSDPWEIAQRNFPHVEDDTGMLATRILRECGGTVLRRARKPWDHVIALAVLRYAARLLRGERVSTTQGFTRDRAIADILTVQSYAEESGTLANERLAIQVLAGRPCRRWNCCVTPTHCGTWCATRQGVATSDRRSGNERSTFMPLAWWRWTTGCCCGCRWRRRSRSPPRPCGRPKWHCSEPLSPGMPMLPLTGLSAPEVVRLHASACLPARAMDQLRR